MRIKVLAVRVDQAPVVEEMEDTLEAQQAFVKGDIRECMLEEVDDDRLVAIYNEDREGLKFNRNLHDIGVHGNFLLHRVDKYGDSVSVTDQDIEKYTRLLT